MWARVEAQAAILASSAASGAELFEEDGFQRDGSFVLSAGGRAEISAIGNIVKTSFAFMKF
jgi:hypothetical protein